MVLALLVVNRLANSTNRAFPSTIFGLDQGGGPSRLAMLGQTEDGREGQGVFVVWSRGG